MSRVAPLDDTDTPRKSRVDEIIESCLPKQPEKQAAALEWLQREGFADDLEEWRALTDKMELVALQELRREAKLTFAEAAHMQRELNAMLTRVDAAAEDLDQDSADDDQPVARRSLLRLYLWLLRLSGMESRGLDLVFGTAFSGSFYRASVLANRESELKLAIMGFCEINVTMLTLFVGGDTSMLSHMYDPAHLLNRVVVTATVAHMVLGACLIINMVNLRMIVCCTGDANMQSCCLMMQPLYERICIAVGIFLYTQIGLFAFHLWILTSHDKTCLIAVSMTFALCCAVFMPGLVAYPRIVMKSGAMDDNQVIVGLNEIATGRGASTSCFKALAAHTHANRHRDIGQIYSGAIRRRSLSQPSQPTPKNLAPEPVPQISSQRSLSKPSALQRAASARGM